MQLLFNREIAALKYFTIFLTFNFSLFSFCPCGFTNSKIKDSSDEFPVENIIKGLLGLRNSKTKLSPSHWGHPGYEQLAFLYDQAVEAMILKAAGYQEEAEEVLDYFALRLRIPLEEISQRSDTNKIYGILKLFFQKDSAQSPSKAFINALDITSLKRQGKGRLEFWTTPGPLAFLIFSLLAVNAEKYTTDALTLGEVLLSMQDSKGAVFDGDRFRDRVHTEPHMDAYAAFRMLYTVSGDQKWQKVAINAYHWFEHHVYHPQEGKIDQGIWSGSPNTIFATDVYSWTMAGPAGDKIPLAVLKKLTETMLKESLVKITLSLPNSEAQTVILSDFSNANDQRLKTVRKGFHPLGSVEWTGGVILALQKNAVRFAKANDSKTAKFYKAIAESLLSETKKCFYFLNEIQGSLTFYATGQGIEVGPFGSLAAYGASSWKTPFFYARDRQGNKIIEGGSIVGAWPLLPYKGFNPFILNDTYLADYNQITLKEKDLAEAKRFIDSIGKTRTSFETNPISVPQASTQLIEPEMFNKNMWEAFKKGYSAKAKGDHRAVQRHFQEAYHWAKRVAGNKEWVELAKRDNLLKEKEFSGLIFYPWGTCYEDNDHPLHIIIWRYPLLNEIGAAMWGMVASNFELKNFSEAKYWIGRIIEEVPLHQIPDVVKDDQNGEPNLIKGYWNALISWEDNPAGLQRDAQMGLLYRQVLKERGFLSAKPQTVSPSDKLIKSLSD